MESLLTGFFYLLISGKNRHKLDHLIVKSLQEGVSIVLDLFLYHLCNLCLRNYLDFKFLFFRFYALFSTFLLRNRILNVMRFGKHLSNRFL